MRSTLIVAVVVVATLAGAVTALGTFQRERRLDVGTVRLSVDPLHRGALDLYVPLVDWGVRFPVVRMPARLKLDVRSVDRDAVETIAKGQEVDGDRLRDEARDGIASYLRELIAIVLVASLAVGLLAAFALRSRSAARLRWLLVAAVATSAAITAALVDLLPPRGDIGDPEYYAHGSDIPRALEAVEEGRQVEHLHAVLHEVLVDQLPLGQRASALVASHRSRSPPSSARRRRRSDASRSTA